MWSLPLVSLIFPSCLRISLALPYSYSGGAPPGCSLPPLLAFYVGETKRDQKRGLTFHHWNMQARAHTGGKNPIFKWLIPWKAHLAVFILWKLILIRTALLSHKKSTTLRWWIWCLIELSIEHREQFVQGNGLTLWGVGTAVFLFALPWASGREQKVCLGTRFVVFLIQRLQMYYIFMPSANRKEKFLVNSAPGKLQPQFHILQVLCELRWLKYIIGPGHRGYNQGPPLTWVPRLWLKRIYTWDI